MLKEWDDKKEQIVRLYLEAGWPLRLIRQKLAEQDVRVRSISN